MHDPKKKEQKKLRYNEKLFMAKELRKVIMLLPKLKNIFNKNKTYFNWQKGKPQQNFSVNILRKTKNIFC